MSKRKQPRKIFRYKGPEAEGTVILERGGGYGPILTVHHGGTKWEFAVDLYYLSQMGKAGGDAHNAVKRCVQIVAYNPSAPDGDPVQHLRVYEDGSVETFVS